MNAMMFPIIVMKYISLPLYVRVHQWMCVCASTYFARHTCINEWTPVYKWMNRSFEALIGSIWQKYIHWTDNEWSGVLFSDETTFSQMSTAQQEAKGTIAIESTVHSEDCETLQWIHGVGMFCSRWSWRSNNPEKRWTSEWTALYRYSGGEIEPIYGFVGVHCLPVGQRSVPHCQNCQWVVATTQH